ncbi:fumarate hydratase [Methanimicrococcus blatticola]|uniref:Fumarase class I alpha subunit n=1 Tax=Methanimicrococcus blatticola TaxID=91560 RepID=A0A484F514_9EURY|nr:fumarate hydratase [Methanimicrococcus blatticola]MBZ3935571.1 fumarate hydratase [Methanimicrococcus blatticola]MCC2509213.1 fumarate hydratase [Methanimicrococcus blatticola]TDQ69420.1 fumarase class I alpha subunit [Methanimicrococcus blatticola]
MDVKIKNLTFEAVSDAVAEILKISETTLPKDTLAAINRAAAKESDTIAKAQLEAILKNIEIAGEKSVPICQDTGIFIFFVEIGRDLHLNFDLEGAIRNGCAKATETVPLRPNVVDPLTRHNTKNNLGDGLPEMNYAFVPGNSLKITVAPKGAGSENMSALKMFTPTEIPKIKEFIVKTVLDAGGKPCPPVILGIGIGGSFNQSAKLAKVALLEKLRDPDAEKDPTAENDSDIYDEFEKEILDAVNDLGIGCMGLGGDTTALSVRVKKASCHTASLPVAVNVQCWANRHATAEYNGGGN